MSCFALTDQERRLLEELIARAALSNEARRAQALLWLDAGENPKAVATRLGASRQTVYNWALRFRRRSREYDVKARLADGKRSGRPPTPSINIDSLKRLQRKAAPLHAASQRFHQPHHMRTD